MAALGLSAAVLLTGVPVAGASAGTSPDAVLAEGAVAPPTVAPPAETAPAPSTAWVTAKPLELSGRDTFIGQASDGSMTYAGIPLPAGNTPEEKKLRKRLLALDKSLQSAYSAYTEAEASQGEAEERLADLQQQLQEARARRDAAQAIVDVYIRAAYVGDPSATGTAELNLLLSKKGADALHAASLLRYGGEANARALDLLRETEAEVARLQSEAETMLAQRQQVTTDMADQLATIRVQLDGVESVLGEEATSKLAAGLGQVPPAVVSSAVTGGEVAPLATRASTFVVLDGVPDRALSRVSALGLPMTVAWFGKATVAGQTVSVAGIDPNTARTFSAAGMAENDDLWRVIARDEAFASHSLTALAQLSLGKELTVTSPSGGATVRLGALATLGWPGTDLVLSAGRARALGAAERRVLLSTDGSTAEEVASKVRGVAGSSVGVTVAGSMAPPASAFLSNAKAQSAFGTMRYVPNANGTVAPDPGWVARNIVTTTVPILGTVTCHRLMIPQLRGALTEVVQAGLASAIHKGEYAGCYYPRYIEYNAARGLSLHSWGVALDMNVPGNLRGTQGELDRRVVAIFKRWGFRWGGDWSYTDPMHFELGALLKQ